MSKRAFFLVLKVLGGFAALVVTLLAGTVFVLNTDTFQNKLLQRATQMLSDKLQTSVRIDSVSIGLFTLDVNLYGLDVEDLQQRKMLQLDHLAADLELWPLLRHEVSINHASIDGVRARLYKEKPDSAANYQFVIDAFKRDSTQAQKTVPDSQHRQKLSLDLQKLSLRHIDVVYNDQGYHLEDLVYQHRNDAHTATISNLQRTWVSHTKKGDVDNSLTIGNLLLWDDSQGRRAEVVNLHFKTDNHQPRKNAGKPKRGYFDAGHFDINASLRADITSIQGDSIALAITQCNAVDRGSGLTVKSLTAKALLQKGVAHLSDVDIQLPNTQLKFKDATIQLPSKKLERPLAFSTSTITGRVVLKDIAHTFAPVLAGFTQPLNLRVDFSGDAEHLRFRNVGVSTPDKLLAISAQGGITGLKDKHDLNVHFHVDRMTAKGGVAERIINQFPVKKFMMKQLNNLGTIHYVGDFSVLWKKEQFQGLLNTAAGNINFQLALDELNKYVLGTARTDSFMLGRVMDMPDIGKVACTADFKFDISKPRTARMRRLKGGKLPIGEVKAEVFEAKYKKVRVRNITSDIQSDGAVANGQLTMKGSRVDVLCSFSFTNTNEMRKTKIKPGVKFHKLSDEDKAARDERRQQKAAERAAKKAVKEEKRAAQKAAKEERRQQKAEERAAKKAAKEEERAAKKAAKEERRQQKAAERAAKKAAKN